MAATMHCPTCDETIPQAHCQDGICLTCGDRLIPLPNDTAQSRQHQQQQQVGGGGAGGGGGDAAFAGGVGSGDDDAAITVDDALSAFTLLPSFPGLDNFMELMAGAGEGAMTMPTANTTTSHRPASQKALDNLKREVLTAKSAELLETRVELFEPCRIDEISSSFIMSSSVTSHALANRRLTLDAIPAEFTHQTVHDNHHPTTATSSANKSSIMTPQQHHQRTTAALVLCTPRTTKGGQLSSQTLSEISLLRKHGIPFIAYVTRGDNVTFVQKALVCQRAGMVSQSNTTSTSSSSSSSTSTSTSRCIGVIVGNAGSGDEVWPYIMQDPKKEAQQFGLTVPVVMVRRDDGRRLVQWANSVTKSKSSNEQEEENDDTMQQEEGEEQQQDNNAISYYTPCRIIIRNKDSESNSCPVCADSFAIGDTIVRLPSCGHVFHEACAMMWLTKHNTCPYCRSELPTEDEEYERERRRRRDIVMNDDDDAGVNGNGHVNFYG